jgi:hypothetical protein
MAQGVKCPKLGRLVNTLEANRLETEFGFCKKLCWSNWSSQRTLRSFGWEGPIFRAISREFPYYFRPIAAVMTSSLAGVGKVCGRLAFTSSVRITLHISGRSHCNRRNTSVSGWRQPEWSVIFCAFIARTKRMLQYWSCVHSTMIPPKRSPAAQLSTHLCCNNKTAETSVSDVHCWR